MGDKVPIPTELAAQIAELEVHHPMDPDFYSHNIPPQLYHLVRQIDSMSCVDGVPVLMDKSDPTVALVRRGEGAVAPGVMWVVGGRKGKKDKYLDIVQAKARSELGASVDTVTQDDYIGTADLSFFPNHSNKRFHSPHRFTVNTPVRLYGLKVRDSSQLEAGDGNTGFHLYGVDQLVKEFDEMHPYIANGIVAALDHTHGKDWRPAALKDHKFPQLDEYFVRVGTID